MHRSIHLIAYPAGETCDHNLCATCRRDHRLKHEGRWHHHLSNDPAHPPGTTIIISPTGHVYLSHPYSYNPLYPPARSKTPKTPPSAPATAGSVQAPSGESKERSRRGDPVSLKIGIDPATMFENAEPPPF